jgi:hypothetical protein
MAMKPLIRIQTNDDHGFSGGASLLEPPLRQQPDSQQAAGTWQLSVRASVSVNEWHLTRIPSLDFPFWPCI